MAVESKVVWNGDKKKKDIFNGTIISLVRSGNIVQASAKRNLTQNKSVDTGNLRASIVQALDSSVLLMRVFTNTVYAPWVEFGDNTTAYRGKPYFQPALDDNLKVIESIFISEGSKAVDK
jgi:hypothetical protein